MRSKRAHMKSKVQKLNLEYDRYCKQPNKLFAVGCAAFAIKAFQPLKVSQLQNI